MKDVCEMALFRPSRMCQGMFFSAFSGSCTGTSPNGGYEGRGDNGRRRLEMVSGMRVETKLFTMQCYGDFH